MLSEVFPESNLGSLQLCLGMVSSIKNKNTSLAMLDRLHTKDRLTKREWTIVVYYKNYVKSEGEERDYLFINCQVVSSIWSSIKYNLHLAPSSDNLMDLLSTWKGNHVNKYVTLDSYFPIMTVIWSVWDEKNRKFFLYIKTETPCLY